MHDTEETASARSISACSRHLRVWTIVAPIADGGVSVSATRAAGGGTWTSRPQQREAGGQRRGNVR